MHWTERPEGEFLDKIQTKVFRVFLLAIHSHLYSFGLRFLFLQTRATFYIFLQTHATSYSFYKGERRKNLKNTIPPSLWFKKSIQKPQVWELLKLCPETSRKLHVHEFSFWICAGDWAAALVPRRWRPFVQSFHGDVTPAPSQGHHPGIHGLCRGVIPCPSLDDLSPLPLWWGHVGSWPFFTHDHDSVTRFQFFFSIRWLHLGKICKKLKLMKSRNERPQSTKRCGGGEYEFEFR